MFVYGPTLLLIGQPIDIVISVVTAVIGIMGIAAAAEGWVFRHALWYERILLFGGSILLIQPGAMFDVLGVSALLAAILLQKFTFVNTKQPNENISV
ncbi:DUF3394 domain-containing protein [Alteribacillus sp. JSM 102045]|uniref:DUF3394 domain-containing protein n=1 Tax=Alteribacillus sp. JSM 102045 TaxID=1562101 RepID=UPI0035C10EB8